MTPTAVVRDLLEQRRVHRRHHLAAQHAARAAARLITTAPAVARSTGTTWSAKPAAVVDRRMLTELEGAVQEWQDFHGRVGAYTVDLGRLVLTSANQAKGAPLIDPARLTVSRHRDTPDGGWIADLEEVNGWAIRIPGTEHHALAVGVRGMTSRLPRGARRRQVHRPLPHPGAGASWPRSIPPARKGTA